MGTYSVAKAKNRLPALIDKAIEGEEVVITRHGKPVAELRHVPANAAVRPRRCTNGCWRTKTRKGSASRQWSCSTRCTKMITVSLYLTPAF